jgi:hypothetical protein
LGSVGGIAMSSRPCPSIEVLQKLLMQKLDKQSKQTVEKHLKHCSDCNRVIQYLEDQHSKADNRKSDTPT